MSNLENNDTIHGMSDKDFENLFTSSQPQKTEIDPTVLQNSINVQQEQIKQQEQPKSMATPYESHFKKVLDERDEMLKDTGHEVLNAINPATVHLADKIIEHELGQEAASNLNNTANISVNSTAPYTSINIQESGVRNEEQKPEMIETAVNNQTVSTPIPDSVNIVTPESNVIKIRETQESIDNFEKKMVEQLETASQVVDKVEEMKKEFGEKLEKLVEEHIEKDFDNSVPNDINIKTENTSTEQVIDEIAEGTKQVQEQYEQAAKKLAEEKLPDEIKIIYRGGDPKKKEELPFREKNNAWAQKFSEIPMDKIPNKIIGKPFELTNDNYGSYMVQKKRFNGLSMTKVALPFSGITLYIKSFSNSTFIQLIEDLARWDTMYNQAKDYADEINNFNALASESYIKLRRTEIEAIYKHVESIYVVDKGPIEKPDFITFLKMIKYPDLEHLYFAIYHGTNKNKRKGYKVICRQKVKDAELDQEFICNTANHVELYDEELVFALVNDKFTIEDFYNLLDDKCDKSTILPITREAHKEIERLTSTKTNIVHHVPSLFDYFETMEILFKYIQKEDVDFDFDISKIDEKLTKDKWQYQNYDIAKLLKSYLYVKEISFLWVTNKQGDSEYKTVSVENGQREIIFDILMDLPYDDMLLLTRGEEIANLMTLRAFEYYVPEITCKECKQKIPPIQFDIRRNFFILLAELRRNRE